GACWWRLQVREHALHPVCIAGGDGTRHEHPRELGRRPEQAEEPAVTVDRSCHPRELDERPQESADERRYHLFAEPEGFVDERGRGGARALFEENVGARFQGGREELRILRDPCGRE